MNTLSFFTDKMAKNFHEEIWSPFSQWSKSEPWQQQWLRFYCNSNYAKCKQDRYPLFRPRVFFCWIIYSFIVRYCLEIHQWDCWLDSNFMVICGLKCVHKVRQRPEDQWSWESHYRLSWLCVLIATFFSRLL